MKKRCKIFFLVGQYYLHAKPYYKLASMLQDRNVECRLYYIGDGSAKSGQYTQMPFKKIRIGIKDLPIFSLNANRGFLNRLCQVAFLVLNKLVLNIFLYMEKPALVVVSGDIADINTRLFLSICQFRSIKVLMIPITIPGRGVINPDPKKNIPMANLVKLFLRGLGLERVVFFRDWVLGSFHKDSIIALDDENTKRLLCENGISNKRLVVVGNLAWDEIYATLQLPIEQIKESVFKTIGCEKDKRIVVYCTEIIQSIYGVDYFLKINQLLYNAFELLPDNIKVIIKYHPREPEDIIELYKQIFTGGRYFFIRNIDNYFLIRSSDVVIGFYSAILNEAALLDVPVLSMRINSNNAPMRFGCVSEFVHITKEQDIYSKIHKILFDKTFINAAKQHIAKWIQSSGIVIDGFSGSRAINMIKSYFMK